MQVIEAEASYSLRCSIPSGPRTGRMGQVFTTRILAFSTGQTQLAIEQSREFNDGYWGV